MSGLRLDPGLLSTAAPASARRFQIESVDGSDAAIYRLWLSRVHAQRSDGPPATALIYSANLSLGLAVSVDFLLDLSQHALVPICFMSRCELMLGQKADLGGGNRGQIISGSSG